MSLIGSGLRLGRHHATDRHAKLCVIVLSGDLGFGDGFKHWVDDDDPEDRITIISAIKLESSSAEVLPINDDLDRALWVLARSMLPVELLCAGREQLELDEVAIKVRQLLNLLLVKIGRDIRAVGFQGTPLSLGSHCDLLRQRSNL